MRAAAGASAVAMPPHFKPSLLRQLKIALSSAAMVERLQQEWPDLKQRGFTLKDCQVVRVHPRDNNTFVLDYEMILLNGEGAHRQRVVGELVGEQAKHRCEELIGKLQKRRRGQLPRGVPTALVTCVPDCGLILRFAGLDEKLRGLKPALDPVVMQPVLAHHLSLNPSHVTACTAELLSHRLGKRCVIRYRLQTRDPITGQPRLSLVIGKVYKFREARERPVFTAMRALWEQGFGDGAPDGIRIARPLAAVSDWQLLLMEDAPGTSLACLDESERSSAIEAAGRTLAKLHRCRLPVQGRHTVEDELRLLKRWVAVVSQISPEMQLPLEEAFAEAEDALTRCQNFEPALVHRDFYEKQVLVNGHQTVLIDFDTLCRSDPAIDLGNFLAHLKWAGLRHLGDAEHLEQAFLRGYGPIPAKKDFFARIEAYTETALLRLVCLYFFWPQWNHLADRVFALERR